MQTPVIHPSALVASSLIGCSLQTANLSSPLHKFVGRGLCRNSSKGPAALSMGGANFHLLCRSELRPFIVTRACLIYHCDTTKRLSVPHGLSPKRETNASSHQQLLGRWAVYLHRTCMSGYDNQDGYMSNVFDDSTPISRTMSEEQRAKRKEKRRLREWYTDRVCNTCITEHIPPLRSEIFP